MNADNLDISNLIPSTTVNQVGYDAPVYPLLNAKAKSLRILLLEPFFPAEAAWGSVKAEQGFIPPMGTIAVYGKLKDRGFNVDFLDTQFHDISEDRLREHLRAMGYDVVALPVFTPTANYAFHNAALVKEVLPQCKVVLGGIHVTSLPELSMEQCPNCDFIIRHEAEYTFDELLVAIADDNHEWSEIPGLVWRRPDGRTVVNAQRPFIGELDNLPSGFYADLDLQRYVPHATQYVRLPNYPVMTQRGCPYKCSYCEASTVLGKKTRFFSPARIIEELKILKNKKGARGFYFQDSTFTIKRAWTMELMELMAREDLGLLWCCNTRADRVDPELLDAMYQAGCRQIALGIESGNQESLDLVRKGTTVEKQTQGVQWIRKAGLRYALSYILCLPGETEEMVENTLNYAKSLGGHIAMFYLPVPYPGSHLYQTCKEMGGLRREANWSDFIAVDFDDPVYVNPNFGIEGMRFWYKQAYKSYYSHLPVWLDNLRALRTREDFKRVIRGVTGLFSLLSHDPGNFLKYQYRGFHGQGAPYQDIE